MKFFNWKVMQLLPLLLAVFKVVTAIGTEEIRTECGSRQVLSKFSWESTVDLVPLEDALYQMAIFIEDEAQLEMLKEAGAHVEMEPLFEEVNEESTPSLFQIAPEVSGTWVFGLFPAETYNGIRGASLTSSKVPYRAIVPYGNIVTFETLTAQPGFEYNGSPNPLENFSNNRRALAGLKWVDAHVMFAAQNIDDAFVEGEMESGWNNGTLIKLANSRVHLRQGIFFFGAVTDENGLAKFRIPLPVSPNATVAKTEACMILENDAVFITKTMLAPAKACVIVDPQPGVDFQKLVVDFKDPWANAYATMTDASQYFSKVVGANGLFVPSQITVMIPTPGTLFANVLPSGMAPCLGLMLEGLEELVERVPVVKEIAQLFEKLLGADVFLSVGSANTRQVPVHEYGHAAMCDVARRHGGFGKLVTTMVDVLLGQFPRIEGAPRPDDVSAGYIWEALGDWATAMIDGSTNYFCSKNHVLCYCAANLEDGCIEENHSPSLNPTYTYGQYTQNVSRWVSIVHDFFDGPGANDGAHFFVAERIGLVQKLGFFTGDVETRTKAPNEDECIMMPPSGILDFIKYLVNPDQPLAPVQITESTVMKALAQAAVVDHSVPFQSVCRLFQVHGLNTDTLILNGTPCEANQASEPTVTCLENEGSSSATPTVPPPPSIEIEPFAGVKPAEITLSASCQSTDLGTTDTGPFPSLSAGAIAGISAALAALLSGLVIWAIKTHRNPSHYQHENSGQIEANPEAHL